jgi:hypothetical protein
LGIFVGPALDIEDLPKQVPNKRLAGSAIRVDLARNIGLNSGDLAVHAETRGHLHKIAAFASRHSRSANWHHKKLMGRQKLPRNRDRRTPGNELSHCLEK